MFLAGKFQIFGEWYFLNVLLRNAFLLQTSTGIFGLGNSQTKCIKSYSTSPMAELTHSNPLKLAKLLWINSRQVTLMLADGSETRFNI